VILLHHVLLMHHVLLSARAHAGTLTGLRVLFLADAPASGGWRANPEIRKGLLVKFSGRRKIVFLLEAFHGFRGLYSPPAVSASSIEALLIQLLLRLHQHARFHVHWRRLITALLCEGGPCNEGSSRHECHKDVVALHALLS
jgi:hypothetical protein